jgi:hypothetical protein
MNGQGSKFKSPPLPPQHPRGSGGGGQPAPRSGFGASHALFWMWMGLVAVSEMAECDAGMKSLCSSGWESYCVCGGMESWWVSDGYEGVWTLKHLLDCGDGNVVVPQLLAIL